VKRLPLLAVSAACSLAAQTSAFAPQNTSPAACAYFSAQLALKAQVAFNISIPNAGPMVFDGSYLWVASSDMVTAVNPATGAVVASQSILGTQFMAYDEPTGTLWLVGGSQSAQLNKVNAQQIIANNGNAPVDSIAFANGLPTALALDSSVSGRNVWAVAGGVASIIQMGTLDIVNTVATPDGFPITQINEAYSLGGMMLSTSGPAGAANVWFYGHTGASVWESPYSQPTLSPGAWYGSGNAQIAGEAQTGVLYEYEFNGGTSNVTLATLQLNDAADSGVAQAGGISGLAVSAPDGVVLVARQELLVPNQVYFVSVHCGPGVYEVPGLTVPGAALIAFGGGFAWASSPGPAGGLTAMTY
jgi:hypothetical protein